MNTKEEQEKSFICKIKNKLEKIYKKWGLAIITTILALAVVVFIVNCTTEKKPENMSRIDSIGTREIK